MLFKSPGTSLNQKKLNSESLSEKDHRCPDSSLEITISQDTSN